jgi:hypothetical protein
MFPTCDSEPDWKVEIKLMFRINGFSDFVHHLDSKESEDTNTTFQKLIYFHPQVRGDTYSVGSLRKS